MGVELPPGALAISALLPDVGIEAFPDDPQVVGAEEPVELVRTPLAPDGRRLAAPAVLAGHPEVVLDQVNGLNKRSGHDIVRRERSRAELPGR